MVLLCDLGGVDQVRQPGGHRLRVLAGGACTGRTLANFLHPEDRAAGTRAVRRAVIGAGAQQVGRYSCRARAADGTWRYVESTVSRYRNPGGPDELLRHRRAMSALRSRCAARSPT